MHLKKRNRRTNPFSAAEIPPEIIEISADLFPGPIEAHLEADPEMPNEQFLVLTARARGKPKELVQRRLEWHRRVLKWMPDANIRLSLTSAE